MSLFPYNETHIIIRHQHDSDIYDYIKIYHFFKLMTVSACPCQCSDSWQVSLSIELYSCLKRKV